MKKKKKVSEMTFKEFWEEAKKRGAPEVIEDRNFGMLTVLRREGFSDKQINEMKIEKAWKFYMDSYSTLVNRMMGLLSRGLEKWPERAPIVQPHLKRLNEMLKEFIKEFEEEGKREKEKKN